MEVDSWRASFPSYHNLFTSELVYRDTIGSDRYGARLVALYVFVILIPSLALLGLCDDDSMRGKALLCALFALVGRFSRITEKLPEMFNQMIDDQKQQGLVSIFVDASSVAQLCSWMAMVGTVGTISGRPIMILAYHYGLSLGDMSHGLPYALAAVRKIRPQFFPRLSTLLTFGPRSCYISPG